MEEVFVLSAVRTPIGRFGGGLASVPPCDLAAKVVREAYPDPTATEGDWSAVDLAPVKVLPRAVMLEEIKRNPKLKGIALLRLSRLSVQPLTSAEFQEILQMGKR